MELRQSLEPHSYQQSVGVSDEHRTHRDADGTTEAHNQSSTELCVVQWDAKKRRGFSGEDAKPTAVTLFFDLIFGTLYELGCELSRNYFDEWFQMDLYWETLMYSIVNLICSGFGKYSNLFNFSLLCNMCTLNLNFYSEYVHYLIGTGKKWKAIRTAPDSRDTLTFELYADAHDGSPGLTVICDGIL